METENTSVIPLEVKATISAMQHAIALLETQNNIIARLERELDISKQEIGSLQALRDF